MSYLSCRSQVCQGRKLVVPSVNLNCDTFLLHSHTERLHDSPHLTLLCSWFLSLSDIMAAIGAEAAASWFLSSGAVGFFVLLLLLSIFLTALCSDCSRSALITNQLIFCQQISCHITQTMIYQAPLSHRPQQQMWINPPLTIVITNILNIFLFQLQYLDS